MLHQSFRNRRPTTIVLLLIFALTAGCSKEMIKSFSDLIILRQELVTRYRHHHITVTRNANGLSVSLANSSFNLLTETEKAVKAQEIASFVKDHYASIKEIKRIWVAFVVSRTYYFVFQRNDMLAAFVFDKNRIEAGNLLSAPKKEVVRAKSFYSQPRNETTVDVNHLLLYGNLDDGLILIPAFTIPGEKVIAPRWVDLEFGSFSDKQLFSDDPRIAISVDGKTLVSGDARLRSSGTGVDGTVAEFLIYKITYQQFLRITSGREAKIKLGAKEIPLTTEHLRLLRDMKGCVESSVCA